MLLSSHALTELEERADRVIIMNRGVKVADGSIDRAAPYGATADEVAPEGRRSCPRRDAVMAAGRARPAVA